MTSWTTVRTSACVTALALGGLACTDGGSDEGGDSTTSVAPATTEPAAAPSTSVEVEPLPVDDEPLELPRDAPPAGAGESLGPLGETELQVETEEGSVEIGSATIPDAAADVPVPVDLVVLISSETTTDLGFSGESMLTVDELVAFYDVELDTAGFTIVGRRVSPGAFAVFDVERTGQVGQIAVSASASAGGSTLIVTLGEDS